MNKRANNEKSIRSFIALEPDDSLKALLKQSINQYKTQKWADSISWTPSSNWHMTLKFLHNALETDLEILVNKLQEQLSNFQEFENATNINISQAGLFPSPEKPLAIVAHVENNPALKLLVETIEKISTSENFPVESREFRGHITLGRCRKGFLQIKKVEQFPLNYQWCASQFHLYKSEPGKTGPVYSKLRTFNF